MGFAANICNLLCIPAEVKEAVVPHEHHMIRGEVGLQPLRTKQPSRCRTTRQLNLAD
jgi:hypothetical protein